LYGLRRRRTHLDIDRRLRCAGRRWRFSGDTRILRRTAGRDFDFNLITDTDV
jgi:hypothetical protein